MGKGSTIAESVFLDEGAYSTAVEEARRRRSRLDRRSLRL
jgi:hypothetical protein